MNIVDRYVQYHTGDYVQYHTGDYAQYRTGDYVQYHTGDYVQYHTGDYVQYLSKLSPVSFVPCVASFCGLFILDSPFGFR